MTSQIDTPVAILPKRQIPWGKLLLGTALLTLLAGGAVLGSVIPLNQVDWFGILQGRRFDDVMMEGLGKRLTRPYQILVLGVDRVLDAPPGSREVFNGRSDSIFLMRFDPVKRQISLLSIPRDTQVSIPQNGRQKVNAANVIGGVELAQAVVSETLNGVVIDRYVRLDTSALAELVDAVGGVEVNVPKRMKYKDNTQKLNIDLYPGKQTLNGVQAEGFARFRNDNEGDIGRMKRQQVVLQAIKAKLNNPLTVFHVPRLMAVMQNHVDTNLSQDEIKAIVAFSMSLKPNQIKTNSLKGRVSYPDEFRYSYWITNQEFIDEAINRKFAVQEPSQSSQ
ncbi:MAG: LCP family protein [Pseudanabaenaceae cyanobacterium]|jgi:LCP family protein required for cell wall assembly